jgi:integrase/recombinase XerC
MPKEWGNLGQSKKEEWDNPCEDFLAMKKDPELEDEEGVTEKRLEAMKRAIVDSPEEVEWQAWDEYVSDWQDRGDPDSSGQLTGQDGVGFYNQMREAGLAKSTIYQGYLPIVQEFLAECMKRNVCDANPVAFVLDQTSPPNTDKDYPEITVNELGGFLRWLGDPQHRAAYTTMSKIATRSGETVNIDLPHLYLDHPIYLDYLDHRGIDLYEVVADKPDSVYIPSEPTVDEKYRGEIRTSGNKTAEGKLLPIDRELKRVLLDWISVRPDVGYPYPLFVGEQGSRLDGTHLLHKLKQELKEYGLTIEHVEDDDKNMDLHYFRHFFSTNMQDSQGTYEGAEWPWAKVKIIRGDKGTTANGDNNGSNGRGGDDLHNTYTHNWGDLIRDPYLRDIYNFGLYKPERELTR